MLLFICLCAETILNVGPKDVQCRFIDAPSNDEGKKAVPLLHPFVF